MFETTKVATGEETSEDLEKETEQEEETETVEEESTTAEDETDSSKREEETDYKAQLEEELKVREKAESSAQYHREQAEKLRKENQLLKDEVKTDEDKPVTKRDLQEIEANLTRKTLRAQVEAEVKEIARNPDEAKLILYHYEHSIVPLGDVAKDISRARLIANEQRVLRENDELRAMLRSKETRGKASGGGGQKPSIAPKEPSLDAGTKTLVQRNKMTWDSKRGLYANDKGVTFDPKTGKVHDPHRL